MAKAAHQPPTEAAPGDAEGAVHGGRLVARTLASRGVSKLFTLSGGHLFSIYDGCKDEGIDIVDTRHEQAATFAAEGWAKATRSVGVAALTAGPGVTNGMSAIAGARYNGSPVAVLGGRAPEMRWGSGSLQEIDHVPFVAPLVKSAETVKEPPAIPEMTARALDLALELPSGPTFVDFPLDVVFMEGAAEPPPVKPAEAVVAEGAEQAASILAAAERPVIMAGTNLYWAHAEGELRELAESVGIPVFLNGMGRGCLPADHELAYSRARGQGLKEADVALVVGVPLDFRLGFGGSFGDETRLIQLDSAPSPLRATRQPEVALAGDIAATLAAIREAAVGEGAEPGRTRGWVTALRTTEDTKRADEVDDFDDERAPLHPMRVYRELREVLERNAIVIGDGGDFVSFAGRVFETYEPGCWMDPGPYGCLGAGPGQAIGAKLAYPERQCVNITGDAGVCYMMGDFEACARHGIGITTIHINNGGYSGYGPGFWGGGHDPYTWKVSDHTAACMSDMARAVGMHAEQIKEPAEIIPALKRALEANAKGKPAYLEFICSHFPVHGGWVGRE
jgi:acetolactate synthase-1/2/3 large subunit